METEDASTFIGSSTASEGEQASQVITVVVEDGERKVFVTIGQGSSCPSYAEVVEAVRALNTPYWLDEETIRKELEKHTLDSPFVSAFAKDGEFNLTIAKNAMEAHLTLRQAYGGREVTAEEIKTSMDNAGIIYGISHGTITSSVWERTFDLPIPVAKGRDPIHGIDARIEYAFPTEFKPEPKLLEHDKIDYKDLQLIFSVNKGDVLARKIPLIPGEAGSTIMGKTLPAKPGRDLRLAAGRNAVVSDDGLSITSNIDGQPLLKGNSIFVEPVLVIKGDVNYSTGNIDFKGSVKVLGSVLSGFAIRATDDIEIEDVVEDCSIEAGRDINIKGGVLGADEGIIKGGRDVTLFFVENCFVEAGRHVYVGNALNSDISAGDTIDAVIGKGRIFGGKLSAKNLIAANILTFGAASKTHIAVGFAPKTMARLKNLKEVLAKIEYTYGEIQKHIRVLTELQQSAPLPEEKEVLLSRLIATDAELTYSLEETKGEITMLETTMTRSTQPLVKVRNTCYPNVRIRIGRLIFDCQEEYHSAVFYEEDDKIKVNVFENFIT